MGIENNECVIATTFDNGAIEKIQTWIDTLPNDQAQLFVILPSIVNHKQTIILGPDGSKKGWPEAQRGEFLRDEFIKKLESFASGDGSNPFDFVEVGYGEYGQKTLRGNCRNRYDDSEYCGG